MTPSDDAQIIPVILCGGSGTRLWPLSRKSYPKQFATLIGETTLFQDTALRLGTNEFQPPVIMTNDLYRFIVTEQLAGVGIAPKSTMIEPSAKGTAPAILAAALHLAKTSPDAMMLVCPSDHYIPGHAAFRKTVLKGYEAAVAGDLVTFGVVPDRPETGYGYLELADGGRQHETAAQKLASFVEKPDLETAAQMLKTGRYLWNSGIFGFTPRTFIDACQTHAADIYQATFEAMENCNEDLHFLRIGAEAWSGNPDISVDYAIMEKAANVAVVPIETDWSDLGSWSAVWQAADHDENGNVCSADSMALECENSLLRSDSENMAVVGIGLKDIAVIAMNDAVLVAHKSHDQKIKDAVARMRASKTKQAETFPVEHRPWGKFESLVTGERFQVKKITVNPGGRLSLQSHNHRAEHWIVVGGTAKVTVGDNVSMIGENQSIYVPLGEKHRLENREKLPLFLIEVQTGNYLGEDDIVRHDDVYARK